MLEFLQTALQQALGRADVRIEQATALAGGSINESQRLSTSAGEFFAKWSARVPADIFIREAEGLAALRSANSGIVIPRVVLASEPGSGHPAFLILEYLSPAGRGMQQDEEKLGRGLAAIHLGESARFGFPAHTYCGSTRQDNAWGDSWIEFYRDRRLGPLLRTLDDRGRLSVANRWAYERLLERLPELLSGNHTPSLIHGDLWSGNVLWTSRGPALIDPACVYAEREMEFGITTLFGGMSERAFSAYEEAWPLPSGWRDRNPLYQLYHLLNHAVLFGGHYEEDARRLAARYVG